MTTLRTLLLTCLFASALASFPRPAPQRGSCLPVGVKAADIVSAERPKGKLVTVNVEQKLKQVRARCVNGKLVDPGDREIRFYRIHSCFGAPTPYALETMRRERIELDSLRKRYTVIAMTCSPDGRPSALAVVAGGLIALGR